MCKYFVSLILLFAGLNLGFAQGSANFKLLQNDFVSSSGSASSSNFNLKRSEIPNIAAGFFSSGNFKVSAGTIFTKNPNNFPVVVNGISDLNLSEDFTNFTVANLDTVFSDSDPNDTLSFSVASQFGFVIPTLNGSNLELSSILNANGTDTLVVTATDLSLASVTEKIVVTVSAVNDAPSTFALLNPSNGDSLLSLTNPINFVWNSATDVDNSSLNYTLRIFDSVLDTTFANLTDTSFTFSGGILDELSTYEWFVIVADGQLSTASLDTFEFHTPQAVGVEISKNFVPKNYSLEQNYPNPFNPTATIKFGIPESGFTSLKVYNVLGQEVKNLVSQNLEASFYEIQWDGKDNNGKTVSSGIYFYRIQAGNFSKSKKMVFAK